jgi:hypothetical protein
MDHAIYPSIVPQLRRIATRLVPEGIAAQKTRRQDKHQCSQGGRGGGSAMH